MKYFEYIQEARIRWFASINRGLDVPRSHFVVAQTDVDYRRPILFRKEPYDLWSQLAQLGNSSITLESEICDGDEVLAHARVTTVFYDLDAGRAVAPDPSVRERLEAELTH